MRIACVALLTSLLGSTLAHADARLEWIGETLPFAVRGATARGNELVAVGGEGAIAFTSGDLWRVETLPTFASTTSIWASPEGDIFVTSTSGELLVREGEGPWRVERSPCDSLRVVAGRSRTDVLVGGQGDCVARFDGHAFSRITLAPSLDVERIVVVAGRTFVGGQGESQTPTWLELRGVSTTRIPLPDQLEVVHALEPAGSRGLLIASDELIEYDGRTYVTHYDDGPRSPRAFLHAGGKTYVASALGLHVIEGRRFVALPYLGRPLLALLAQSEGLLGVTARGERVRITPAGSEIHGGLLSAAGALCATPGGAVVVGEWGRASVSGRLVRVGGAQPACEPSHREAGNSVRFVRENETFALAEQAAGEAFVRVVGGDVSTLADAWALARFPSDVAVVGGSATRDGPVFAAGQGYAVRFAEGRMHRHLFGRALRSLEPRGIRDAGGALFFFGGASALLRWDGQHLRPEPTVASSIVDVSGDGARTLALARGFSDGGSSADDFRNFMDEGGELELDAGDDESAESGARAFDGRVLVRRDAGYFASIDSTNDLESGLLGYELGRTEVVFGASPTDVVIDTPLGFGHFDGSAWSRASLPEPHPIVAIVGRGRTRFAVSVTGRVLSLAEGETTTERVPVRESALSAYVDASGTLFVGGVGFVVERGASGFARVWTAPAFEYHPPVGQRPSPGSDAWNQTIAAFATLEGRVHAWTNDGRWLVRTESGFVLADRPPLAFASTRPDLAQTFSPGVCAALEPRADRVVVVSCFGAAYAAVGNGAPTEVTVPGHTRLSGATCIPGDACYFFHARGAFRVDPATL